MSVKTTQIEVRCSDCGGTGLYHGFAEPPGVAVVCRRCNGEGKTYLEYEPFTGRVRRDDIQTVRLSKGTTVLGMGPTGKEISYEEFFAGKLPEAD